MSDKEYDDENSGAVFPPFADQKYILQGEIDIEKSKHKVVVVKGKTKQGVDIIRFYTELCAIFPNLITNQNAPDYTGTLNDSWNVKNNRIAAWVKEYGASDGNGVKTKYMNLQFSEPQTKETLDNTEKTSNDSIDDEIPF